MKGFKKDGKFRPTEKRTKSALSKADKHNFALNKVQDLNSLQQAEISVSNKSRKEYRENAKHTATDIGMDWQRKQEKKSLDKKPVTAKIITEKEKEKMQNDLAKQFSDFDERLDARKRKNRNDESLDEEDPHEIPQTIFDQLKESTINGFPFFAYTGIKGFVMMGNDTLMLKDIPRNPNHISSVTVQYDEGRDLYNLIFQKGKFPKNVPVKELDGIFFDQLSDIIVDTMGVR